MRIQTFFIPGFPQSPVGMVFEAASGIVVTRCWVFQAFDCTKCLKNARYTCCFLLAAISRVIEHRKLILVAVRRSLFFFVIAWLALVGGCARLPDTGKTLLTPKTFSELQGYLLNHKADLDEFRLRGPFAVAEQDDYEIRLSTTELIKTDLFLSAHAEKAPLVISAAWVRQCEGKSHLPGDAPGLLGNA